MLCMIGPMCMCACICVVTIVQTKTSKCHTIEGKNNKETSKLEYNYINTKPNWYIQTMETNTMNPDKTAPLFASSIQPHFIGTAMS